MTPEITEFSYGFALTNEMVGWAPLNAAPLFPSLIEEGKAGGGYDLKLDLQGFPLYLQFKRADYMKRASAAEVSKHNLPISRPFYRFKITEAKKSNQHDLLLELDDGSCLVFYAAPRFHELDEINDAWLTNSVASRSIFVQPSAIGPLDDEPHHVAYDQNTAWICSEPRELPILSASGLMDKLSYQLNHDDRPLREKIPEIVERIRAAEVRARKIFEAQERPSEGTAEARSIDVAPVDVPLKAPRALTEDERLLRAAADLAYRIFDSQMIIIQPK